MGYYKTKTIEVIRYYMNGHINTYLTTLKKAYAEEDKIRKFIRRRKFRDDEDDFNFYHEVTPEEHNERGIISRCILKMKRNGKEVVYGVVLVNTLLQK